MAPPRKENAEFFIHRHKLGGHVYAATRPAYINEKTGKRDHKVVHWGKIIDNVFVPNEDFFALTPEDRAKFMFPDDVDTGTIKQLLPSKKKRCAPKSKPVNRCRFYGDIWLLEQIVQKIHLKDILMEIFEQKEDIVNDLLTLAYYQCITGYSLNHVARWQRIEATPSDNPLTPSRVTRLTQKITEEHRIGLLKHLAKRVKKNNACAVDSTTVSSYGDLANTHWGYNKEGLDLEVTMESVVYSLDDHIPIYYRIFSGNYPDSMALSLILDDLRNAHFEDLIYITDRGYDSKRNFERYISEKKKAIMALKTTQGLPLKILRTFKPFEVYPEELEFDPRTGYYMKQFDEEYKVEESNGEVIAADNLKINIYLNTERRTHELNQLRKEINIQETDLRNFLDNHETLPCDAILKRNYSYYTLKYDPDTRVLVSYTLNQKKIEKKRLLSGFFSNATIGLELSALEAHLQYKLRDEQEKHFRKEKSMMSGDRIRASSEEGVAGRHFLLFLSLILSAYLTYTWKSTDLKKKLATTKDVLDEMRTIQLIERSEEQKTVTPFIGLQVDITEAFGFEFPPGCEPNYTSKQVLEKKRGRPKKPEVESCS